MLAIPIDRSSTARACQAFRNECKVWTCSFYILCLLSVFKPLLLACPNNDRFYVSPIHRCTNLTHCVRNPRTRWWKGGGGTHVHVLGVGACARLRPRAYTWYLYRRCASDLKRNSVERQLWEQGVEVRGEWSVALGIHRISTWRWAFRKNGNERQLWWHIQS